jgi:hypothetical protein
MQDEFPMDPVPANGATEAEKTALTPLDEAAIAATSTLATGEESPDGYAANGDKESAAVAKDQWVGNAEAAIRNRPLTALGLAVLAGAALALLFSSGSSDSDA